MSSVSVFCGFRLFVFGVSGQVLAPSVMNPTKNCPAKVCWLKFAETFQVGVNEMPDCLRSWAEFPLRCVVFSNYSSMVHDFCYVSFSSNDLVFIKIQNLAWNVERKVKDAQN